jgi:4-hydroxybenzoate polyprenyltransferase
MNIAKFYRLDFCFRNLGLGIIALFSLEHIPRFPQASLAILQILLVQMHSFSSNNYFDATQWGELNYINDLLQQGVNRTVLLFLTLMPLFVLILTIPFSNRWFVLLAAYLVLFALYHLPAARKIFKEHYLPSIVINSLCLGTILYLYPYLFLARGITMHAIAFSIIFFLYLAFHEIVHQIAHLGQDKIYSLPQAIGIQGAATASVCFLWAAALVAAYMLAINPAQHFVFAATIIFCLFRVYRLRRLSPTQDVFKKIRNRKDKFYSLQEGVCYIILLGCKHLNCASHI